jgi:hypothetical protein
VLKSLALQHPAELSAYRFAPKMDQEAVPSLAQLRDLTGKPDLADTRIFNRLLSAIVTTPGATRGNQSF